MFEAMLQGEMEKHLGYDSNSKDTKETENRRNGYSHKSVKTSMGEMDIDVPRDRDGSFDPGVSREMCKFIKIYKNIKLSKSKFVFSLVQINNYN